jgi:prepilin-type N-terminal cleavage/methylation domain-containing protein
MKHKNQAFTLIELLVVIVLVSILSVVSLGSGRLFESSWKFELENKKIIKLIQDARVNSITARTCGDRTKAAKNWQVTIQPKSIALQCLYNNSDGDKVIVETDSVSINHSDFKYDLSDNSSGDLKFLEEKKKIIISFFAVSAEQQSEIMLEDIEYNKIRLVFISNLSDRKTKNTICYDRLGGFTSFSYEDKCID